MKILPPTTLPPTTPIKRRHRPNPAEGERGFRLFRECLRWDFGFTCAFCLLHEADLCSGSPCEGSGLTGIEHWVPQSKSKDKKNDYKNCIYICRYCNTARSNKPNRRWRRKLLNPTKKAWSVHFASLDDQLVPLEGDSDALYTEQAYDINEPRKVGMRLRRKEFVTGTAMFIQDSVEYLRWLNEIITRKQEKDSEIIIEALEKARFLWRAMLAAKNDLERFSAVPRDAPAACRCNVARSLPRELLEQMIEVPNLQAEGTDAAT